ncbi:MAG TPA: molybdopterin cofactor-binding domain-containing protein [Myxococcales bacterium]|nr:molybdopterin cofactor-binding domain-containing protein [Myxococcales bacterium]
MSGAKTLTRRQVLRIGALATGALLPWPARSAERADPDFRPNVFVQIDGKGRVEVTIPRPEMGQGVRTAIAVLVADELGVPLDRVRLRQADFAPEYGPQYVGGSNSMRGSWGPLRAAGAAAREMLVQAAATRWSVPVEECDAREGSVVHSQSGRRAPFGSLVRAAAALPVPASPKLRDAAGRPLVGGRHRGLDVPDIVRGAVQFGLDVRVPGMLVASVERSPSYGARPERIDGRAALGSKGVKAVVSIDPDRLPEFPENSPKPPPGVAVIADGTWQAMQARKSLRIEWSGGSADDSERMRQDWSARLLQPPHFVERNDGEFDKAFASAERRHEATYEVPFLAHAPMEPMNCVADVRPDRCDVWAPTQDPEGAHRVARLVSGLPGESVKIHPTRMGGGFGRRFYSDYVAEAVHLSKSVKAPVQVAWTREDDIRHCFFRPAGIHRLQGGVTAGRVSAWSHHLVNASRGTFLRWTPEGGGELHPGEVDRTDFPANFVPDFRLAYSEMPSSVPRGQWRAVEDSANVFVVQGFLDELAALAGRDPVELQLEMLSKDIGPAKPRREYDAGRLRAVIEMAAERAGWSARKAGTGFAACFSHGGYVAEIAEVSRWPGGGVRVRRMVAAVDCGTPVNRLGIEAQVRGAIVYGLSAALHQQITVRNGMAEQENFADYTPLRIAEMPEIEVHIVDSSAPPGGMGEAALSPAAPAVANALFSLDGTRVRRLPLPI